MSQPNLHLTAFPTSCVPGDVSVTADITRRATRLGIRYVLTDVSSCVAIPATVDIPLRKNNLWEETCFEFFISPKLVWPEGEKMDFPERYWEFNFAPSSNWNVYRFDAYRQGMKAEPAFNALPFQLNRKSHSLTLEVEIDLEKISLGNLKIQVGISAVVKLKNGEVIYWALTHCGKQPDFHLRESFVVEM